MKLDISCADRLGITQEILTVFSSNSWNIRAMEVKPEHIYIHFLDTHIPYQVAAKHLLAIPGVIECREVSWLPSEEKAQHLDTLLSNIPIPILDINLSGRILMANSAAHQKVADLTSVLKGRNITEFIDLPLTTIMLSQAQTIELHLNGQAYYAEITPVINQSTLSGAVIVLNSLNRIGQQLAVAQSSQDNHLASMIGESSLINELRNHCEKFAQLDLPVLICGETGTGKELAARTLHLSSARSKSPFLAINCAALPEHLLESELFGYAPGAFSGAQRSGKPGLFELGNGGTVFLDEIGEMSVYLQAKLLRFLQDYRFRRVGGTKELAVDVRVISATHRNIPQLVAQGHFREDLYYRLNVLQLTVPALRERAEDIPLLAEYFLSRAAKQLTTIQPRLTKTALKRLTHNVWPGNIRQLQNVLFRSVALAESATIDEMSLALDEQSEVNEATNVNEVSDWKTAIAVYERSLLESLLPAYPTTRKLAKRLNVSHNTIAIKLRQYGLS